MEAWNLPAVR
jgi:hypothetical protein